MANNIVEIIRPMNIVTIYSPGLAIKGLPGDDGEKGDDGDKGDKGEKGDDGATPQTIINQFDGTPYYTVICTQAQWDALTPAEHTMYFIVAS